MTRARSAQPGVPYHGLGESAYDVLDSLRRLGPTSATAIAEDTGRTMVTINQQLWRLHARGLVEHAGDPPRFVRRIWRAR